VTDEGRQAPVLFIQQWHGQNMVGQFHLKVDGMVIPDISMTGRKCVQRGIQNMFYFSFAAISLQNVLSCSWNNNHELIILTVN